MTGLQVVEALHLPAEARIDQRVTKKLLLERSRATAAQKRSLQEGIDELLWIASLKPNTIGVAAYRDQVREYLEIAILLARLRPAAKASRIVELIHRAIPYPVFLIVEQPGGVGISLAHKRWSEAEHGETVAEELHQAVLEAGPAAGAFLGSLDLAAVRAADMRALYQGWIDRVTAFQASTIGGTYTVPQTPEDALALRIALQTYVVLTREILGLRAIALKEMQVSRQVELNLAVKRLEAERSEVRSTLGQAGLGEIEER